MKNLKFSYKMLIMIGVLVLTAGAITAAAVAQLNTLNSEVRHLVDVSTKILQTAEGLRIDLLEAIRYDLDSVISVDDAEGKSYADTALQMTERVERDREALLKLLGNRTEEKALMAEFSRLFEERKKIQKDALHWSVLHTNAKAMSLVTGRFLERSNEVITNVQLLLDQADRELAGTHLLKDDRLSALAAKKTRTLRGILDRQHELIIQTMAHAMVTSDKEKSRLDLDIKDLYSKVRTSIQELRADTEDRERPELDRVVRALAEIESSGRDVQDFSHENSNGKAIANFLGSARQTNVAIFKIIDQLLESLDQSMEEDKQSAERLYQASRFWMTGGALLAILFSLVLAVWISRSLTQTLVRCAELFSLVAKGDLTGRMNLDQTDEIGQLAQAMDQVTETLHGVVGRIRGVSQSITTSSDRLSRVSQGLLSQSEEMSVQAVSVASGTEEMSTTITTMAVTTEQMSINMTSISSVSEQISVNVSTIAQAAEDTTRNVEAVNAAIDGITRTFKTIAGDAKEGAQVTDRARQMASHATETMSVLDTSAGEINKVTEVIKMIALQTNLLALNATIEATSAGEAGKGFAVVASEIKELAAQSARAAEEIARKIESIQISTRDAVKVIDSVAQTIDAINSSAGRISDAVANQTQVAQGIFNNVGEANRRIANIAKNISEVSKGTTDLSRNTSEASRGATDVSRNATEAAKVAERVTANIHEVSLATKESTASAIQVNQSAQELHTIATDLIKIVGQFRLER